MSPEPVRHLAAVPDNAPSSALIVDEAEAELSPTGDGPRVVRPAHITRPSKLVGVSFVLSALAIAAILVATTVGEVFHPHVAIAALVAVAVIDGLLTTAEILSIRSRRG